jgi:hypothetical protein
MVVLEKVMVDEVRQGGSDDDVSGPIESDLLMKIRLM